MFFCAVFAFVFSFWYVHQFPLRELQQGSHSQYMLPAVNYACTGKINTVWQGGPGWSEADQLAIQRADDFLTERTDDDPCSAFPQDVPFRSIFDGLDYSNDEAPVYLTLLYGQIWRFFGVTWMATYYVVGLTGALTFLVLYGCARPFVPAGVAALVGFAFLICPMTLASILTPRDFMKVPFVIGVTALLIWSAAKSRRVRSFLGFACAVGVAVGIGYGFRPDLLLFLPLAVIVITGIVRLELGSAEANFFRRAVVRLAAVACFLASFGIAGWLPVLNDYLAHPYDKDIGFHILTMGQEGTHNSSLFQDHPAGGMYGFRNTITSDVPVILRVVEYAQRHDGAVVSFETGGPYWSYAKQYYLRLVSLIPADLLSDGIGAFVNLMTAPASLRFRPPEPNRYRADIPWQEAYRFASGSFLYKLPALKVDRLYQKISDLPLALIFCCNLIISFLFFCIIAIKTSFRAFLVTLICLGSLICVTSLDFEMRHMFYLYAVPLIAWVTVAWWAARLVFALFSKDARRRLGYSERLAMICGHARQALRPAAAVSATVAVVIAVSAVTLTAARMYQAATLRSLISDWLSRRRVPAVYAVAPTPADIAATLELKGDTMLMSIKSPMPLSNGGEHAADAPLRSTGDMGVVAVTLDGEKCHGRTISLTGFANSNPAPTELHTTAYTLMEEFQVSLTKMSNYIAFFPAFYYMANDEYKHATLFSGIDMPADEAPCIKGMELVTQFKKSDIIFDYFIPENPQLIKASDLYKKVEIPGIGYI